MTKPKSLWDELEEWGRKVETARGSKQMQAAIEGYNSVVEKLRGLVV